MILRTGKNKLPGKGFTLIEVLLAVSILAIGLVGVLRAYATSTTAMERIQYDMNAVVLLKIAMGQIEEKAIIQGDIVPGVLGGEFTAAEEAGLDVKNSGPWLWSRDVQKMDLPSPKVERDLEKKETKQAAEKKPEIFLNTLKLTVVNSGKSPLREVSLETYVRTESVKRP